MKVLILAGGESEEKSISMAGGLAVHQAVNESAGWESVLVDPATKPWQQIECDVIFPVLHGADGEDGALQKVLEQSGRPFVGSGSTACELTFDKAACSSFLKQRSVQCPPEITVEAGGSEESWHTLFDRLSADLPATKHWVVKPNQQGSSVGVSVLVEGSLDFRSQLTAAIRGAFQFDSRCLIQQYIGGREITVSMLDGEALSPIEICVPSGFYDFHAKYESGQTEYQIVHDEAAVKCCELAQKINGDCGTAGIVRIDFRIDESGQPWFLELNTIPGMTERSLVPKSAADRGWSLARLCCRAIRNAVNRPLQDTSAS